MNINQVKTIEALEDARAEQAQKFIDPASRYVIAYWPSNVTIDAKAIIILPDGGFRAMELVG